MQERHVQMAIDLGLSADTILREHASAGDRGDGSEVSEIGGHGRRHRFFHLGFLILFARVTRRGVDVGHGASHFTGIEVIRAGRWFPRLMREFETENQRPWIGGCLLFLDEPDRVVGADVVNPAGGGNVPAIDDVGAIRILAVADLGRVEVEFRAFALGAHVPLADVGRGAAGRAHQGGMGDIVDGKGPEIRGDAIVLLVAAEAC